MNASKQELFDEIKKCIAMDAERWITIHPFGKGGKGNNNNNNAGGKAPYVRVLIDDDGVIKAGMGGTHNGEKISQLGKNKDTNEKKEDSTISSYKNRDMSHVKYFDGILSELSRIKKDYLEYIDGLSEWKKRDLHNPDEFYGIPEVDEQYAVIKEALEKAKDFKIDDKDVFKDTDKLIPPDGASDEELERFNVPSNFAWGKDMTDWSDAWHRARLYLNDFDDLSKEEISTVLNAAQRVRDSQKYWENIDTLISDAIDKKREGKKGLWDRMLDRNAGIESYSLRTKTLFSMLTSEIKQELRRIEEESAKAIRDLYNSGGKLKQDGTDRRGTFINGAGEYTLWRAADKDFPLSSGTEAVYFATTYKQAKDYEHRGIEAKKGYESNKETHAYKVKIENPLIIERAGYHDLGTAMERWKVLFPDEPFPRQTDNYAWWRRMDRKCERRAKELGYDAIVTSCEDFREVAVLGKKLKKDKAIQMDSKYIFDGIITLIQ